MACLTGLVVLVLMVTAEAYVGPSNESIYCTEIKECLFYNLTCNKIEYEVRHYSPTKWVSTYEESFFMEMAIAIAFRRLYQYIRGANDKEVEIAMTAPVVVKIKKRKFWRQRWACTLNFRLPSAYQESPPTPTNRELYFTDMPDMKVYVRSFRGWINFYSVSCHAKRLRMDLDHDQASYEEDFYAVGYDSPMKLKNRHNEIWYQAERTPDCS